MFGRGRGHAKCKEYAKKPGLKALEAVKYATPHFTSSSLEQWEEIYESFEAMIKQIILNQEEKDDECEETKYKVCGQDYAIYLCGMITF
eukprot:Seg6168.1 transcript_id=Seg6168.1/GoldUCD/mRNA.D3Y31 product="hypothetical protein" pseudo=true protein_id=Seg6168.1/GoldUCD/D3Y31